MSSYGQPLEKAANKQNPCVYVLNWVSGEIHSWLTEDLKLENSVIIVLTQSCLCHKITESNGSIPVLAATHKRKEELRFTNLNDDKINWKPPAMHFHWHPYISSAYKHTGITIFHWSWITAFFWKGDLVFFPKSLYDGESSTSPSKHFLSLIILTASSRSILLCFVSRTEKPNYQICFYGKVSVCFLTLSLRSSVNRTPCIFLQGIRIVF